MEKKTGSYMLAISSFVTIIIIVITLIKQENFRDFIVYSVIQMVNSIILLILSIMYIKGKITKEYENLYKISNIAISICIGVIEILKFESGKQCCAVFFTPITIIIMIVGSFIILISSNKSKGQKNEIKTTN